MDNADLSGPTSVLDGNVNADALPPPVFTTPTLPRVTGATKAIAGWQNPRPKQNRGWRLGLIVSGAIVSLTLVVVVVWPTWESRHAEELLSLKRDADAAFDRKQLVEAYEGYQRVVQAAGNRQLSNRQLAREVEDARKAVALLEAPARAERAKREVEQRTREERARREREAREAELARQEAQRREAERQARAEEERARREREAREAELARQEAQRERIKASPAYRALIARAEQLVQQHDRNLADEDSAYRAISQTAGSLVSLLGVLVQQEAMLDGMDLRSEVRAVELRMEQSLAGETSAIRAAYKKDAAFLEMLGLYATVLDRRYPGAGSRARHKQITAAAVQDTRFDDSAPRAITAYLQGCMLMMAEIARLHGSGAEAAAILKENSRLNRFEDSTWRAGQLNAEAMFLLAAVLLEQSDPIAASALRDHARREMVGETSALRAQHQYRLSLAAALLRLIQR